MRQTGQRLDIYYFIQLPLLFCLHQCNNSRYDFIWGPNKEFCRIDSL